MSEKEDQYWNEIDDYLDGSLDQQAHKAFRQRLSEENKLAKDTLFQQEMRQGIAFGSQQNLRSRLQVIHEETIESNQEAKIVPIGRQLWLRWSVAAGLLVGALGILFLLQQNPSSQELFADNYEVYSLDPTSRSGGEENPAAMALEAYQQQDYTAAIKEFDHILQNEPEQPTLQLALAISYWENGQTEQAKSAIKTLFNHPILKDQAFWYAALFALAEDNPEAAVEYLEKIPTDSGQLHTKAAKLLDTLQ
ncbi:tetratricopeptide repeat protein [Lewinella cohaerens]|uniref:tetratricopeptide repeat protein n=1 Tax=Lewinella cohaerens TaxID=70995 RepID=UPI00035F4F34|nr:tetratricopeptide repeat protein [Lewinella cohaerens]